MTGVWLLVAAFWATTAVAALLAYGSGTIDDALAHLDPDPLYDQQLDEPDWRAWAAEMRAQR